MVDDIKNFSELTIPETKKLLVTYKFMDPIDLMNMQQLKTYARNKNIKGMMGAGLLSSKRKKVQIFLGDKYIKSDPIGFLITYQDIITPKVLKKWLIKNGGLNVNLTLPEMRNAFAQRIQGTIYKSLKRQLLFPEFRQDFKTSTQGVVGRALSFNNIPKNSQLQQNLIHILTMLYPKNTISNWDKDIEGSRNICFDLETKDGVVVIGVDTPANIIVCHLIQSFEADTRNSINVSSGHYTYIVSYDEKQFYLDITQAMPQEIGTKHYCILYKIKSRNPKSRIAFAGELSVRKDGALAYNFESGTIMLEVDKNTSEELTGIEGGGVNTKYTLWWGPLAYYIFNSLVRNRPIIYTNKELLELPPMNEKTLKTMCMNKNLRNMIKKYKTGVECRKNENGEQYCT